ncbi:MAG: sulfonate ABC transporter permease [Gammaproteobacteria bacterium 13_2_20CM_66_19]|nr:MAG: sulfonate ABC transporter permease [Gammaproteobacteria bacterium 13_2_20CM_66_19]TLZ10134.1 MAG: ABC transporter permease subunit [Gammaproteobacteria bacterium]
MRLDRLPISVLRTRYVPGGWDLLAFVLVFAFFVYAAQAARGLAGSLAHLEAVPISLAPSALVGYSARTALRMLIAMSASLVFTFTYATLAAKSRRAEVLLVPLLDFLQSVPILSFSITLLFFLQLTPGRVAGAEMAAIFLIFTSQAWNMAFSFYHSLRSIPDELIEAARNFRLSPWMRFWRLEVPFAMPALIWNMMLSMSGGWFFLTVSEAINVGHTTVTLPGVGSYIALAIEQKDLAAIGWAIGAMFVVILVFDQLLFRPLTASADWFRLDQEVGLTPSHSWALTMMRRSHFLGLLARAFAALLRAGMRPGATAPAALERRASVWDAGWVDYAWYALLALMGLVALSKTAGFVLGEVRPAEIGQVVILGLITLLRVAVLIALASLIWVPIGVWIGLRPRVASIAQPIAQFLAAFPANLLFPIVISAIVLHKLDPDIWLSPLIILGTQWYILFNVIVGASALAPDLRYAAENLGVHGWLWWRRVALPSVFPFFVTGAITASGGSWNASIVAEVVSWGQQKLTAHGLGAYIAEATIQGDFQRSVLGTVVLSLFVVTLNRVFWRPLYARAERKFRIA